MSIQTKYTTSLELDKVLAKLANETTCEAARLRALHLTPVTTEEEAVRLMAYTADANRLTNRYGTPTAQNVRDCTGSLERARLGAQLPIPELLSILHLLETIRRMIGWKKQSEEEVTALDYLFSCLTSFKSLEDELKGAILDEETLSDSASPALADIRRKIRNNQQKVRSQLDNMIRSSSYQKYLQDAIVTMRDGRYVVPVKAEYRSEVKGLVHDTSSSGATVFIEPMSVVEANNEIKVLESQEKKEIDRILYELSASVGSYAEAISRSYEVLVELDLYFAKSRLADKMKASVPQITGDRKIKLIRARHPLIDPEKIVPVDVTLGVEFDTLVITGPNTGGKTVLLKTVGLLTLMMMCGLMIPAADGSSLSVFDEVLSDIGDEQSIEQSLSTFSAHMKTIVSIMDCCGQGDLVLFDELGAGTDPVEGAALAVAVIGYARQMGACVAATTHYAELKTFALTTDGVENASCEFNVQSLQPTYRLLTGIPGKSNAFAIAARLGLQPTIIERAKEQVSTEDARFEDVLAELERERRRIEQMKEEAQKMRAAAQSERDRMRAERDAAEARADKLLEGARSQADRLLKDARMTAETVFDELEDMKKKAQKDTAGQNLAAAKAALRGVITQTENEQRRGIQKRVVEADEQRPVKKGDRVRLINVGGVLADVLAPADKSGNVQVQAGPMKMTVKENELCIVEEQAPVKKSVQPRRDAPKRELNIRSAESEVDVRGMSAQEALFEVDNFLSRALMAGLPSVTVIHGKGTGVLRNAVQQHLRSNKRVKSVRSGVYGEGEQGVTIVELR